MQSLYHVHICCCKGFKHIEIYPPLFTEEGFHPCYILGAISEEDSIPVITL